MSFPVLNPGSIVVPLSAIIDQLQGKLTSNDINALLYAIIGGRTQHVNAGDLITAELINQVLGDISDLQLRVTQLESGGASTPGLLLFRPVDGAQFKVGEDMVLEGRNLGFVNGSAAVSVDGIPANEFRPGSNDEKITVKVPGVPVSTAEGRDVLLVVSNGTTSAIRTIRVRPAQDLAGAIDVTWVNVTPNPIVPGGIATFEFVLHSRANLDASWALSPVISQVANAQTWNDAVRVLIRGVHVPSRLIPVRAGGEESVEVQINPVPNVNPRTTFSLSVSAVAGGVAGGTGRLRMIVTDPITLPDLDVTVSIGSAEFFPAGDGAFVAGVEFDSLRLKRTATAILTLVARVKVAGQYVARIDAIASPGVPTTNWTLARHPQDPADPNDPTQSLFGVTQAQVDAAGPDGVAIGPRFQIMALQNASAQGEAQLKVERKNSGKSRTRAISLTAS
jgi:hypothetical protein